MTRRTLCCCLLSAFAYFLLAYGIVAAILPLLPGGQDLLGIGLGMQDELGSASELVKNTNFQVLAAFLVFVVPALVLLNIARYLNRNRELREGIVDPQQQISEAWGRDALAWWLDQLEADAGSGGKSISEICHWSQLNQRPHMVEFHRLWHDRVTGRLRPHGSAAPSQPPTPSAVPAVSPTINQTKNRVAIVVLTLVSVFLVVWGILNLAAQLHFAVLPVLDIKTSTATQFLGLGSSWSLAVFPGMLAFRLARAAAEARRHAKEAWRRQSTEQQAILGSLLQGRLERLATSAPGLAGDLAGATLEVAGPAVKKALIEDWYSKGLLKGPQALCLQGTDLRELDLAGVEAAGILLAGVRLEGANLDGARLDGAVLDAGVLRHASLRGASLRGASLRGADFAGAQCQKACFAEADWTGANFTGANLWGSEGGPQPVGAPK